MASAVSGKGKGISTWASLFMLLALALPGKAQDAALISAEELDFASLSAESLFDTASRKKRTGQAKALAAPFVAQGMDAAEAFVRAWAALAQAGSENPGAAAKLLEESRNQPLKDIFLQLNDAELAALRAAVVEEDLEEDSPLFNGLKSLAARFSRMFKNNDGRQTQGAAIGVVQGTGGGGGGHASHGGEAMPSVSWLGNHSGSLLQFYPSQVGQEPPFTVNDTVDWVDGEPDEPHSPTRRPQQTTTLSLTDDEDEKEKKDKNIPQVTTKPRMMASFGASSSGGGGGGMRLFSAAPMSLMADLGPTTDAPAGAITWNGSAQSSLKDGAELTFAGKDAAGNTMSNTKLDVVLNNEWRPYDIIVDDNGVSQWKRAKSYGNVGYAFTGEGYIADYEDHATSLTKKGNGILVLANTKNSYSGGTDVQQGILYVADQGALGTGAVTLHNNTAMWVNYTWNDDYSSSFRNPVVSNTLHLADKNAAVKVSYGDFPWVGVLGKETTRIWRNLYLTGGVTGDKGSSLYLQGYTSRVSGGDYYATRIHLGDSVKLRGQLWYSGFILNRTNAGEDEGRFYGTVTLGNHVSDSTASVDNLSNRETGAVKLTLTDDVLEYATLNATREFVWMKNDKQTDAAKYNELLLKGTINGVEADNYTTSVSDAVRSAYAKAEGTESTYGTYGLKQTHSHVILIANNTKVGALKADLLGVTQDTYRDAANWSEALEVKQVRVVTMEENATLTLGKNDADSDSWFSGTLGLPGQWCDANGDGMDALDASHLNTVDTNGSTIAGISLVKTGNNAQYIHTAVVHNLNIKGGTLGFNNVELVSNLTLASHTTLRLGVQDGIWKDAGAVHMQVGDGLAASNRFAVLASEVDSKTDSPFSARVEGSLSLNDTTELAFEEISSSASIIPAYVMEGESLKEQKDYLSSHSLLQVTAATGREDGADKGGVLTLSNTAPISISGINFLREDYAEKIYFLAAADKIQVNADQRILTTASDFSTRVITLGYGYYGLISTIDGHGTYINNQYTAYDENNARYLGQDYLVMRVAADPTRSWSGSGLTSAGHDANVWTATGQHYDEYLETTGLRPDAQWKENQAYTDGASVKFGNLWLPTEWEDFLSDNEGANAKLEDFAEQLKSKQVTKVGGELFSSAPTRGEAVPNGTQVTFGGLTYGSEGSTYSGASTEQHSNTHFEKVVIEGIVRPGYVTINSDFNLRQPDGSYVTVQDDTNYVFTGTGSIANATTEQMNEIYGSLLDSSDLSVLNNWQTGLAKGGTGTLVIETQNAYSGGSMLHGGLTVMGNKWALGMENPAVDNPELDFSNPNAKGGKVEMAYGAGLMANYISADSVLGNQSNAIDETIITNDITITHMVDFDNTGATGDAQLLNLYNSALTVRNLSSYDDAILTLRGVSLTEDDARAHKPGDPHTYYNYAAYLITNPVNAYGTIRMAGYLQGDDGTMISSDGTSYVHGGGKVQLTLTGHDATKTVEHPLWQHTTIDLSLNGGKENVLALDTRFVPNADLTDAKENTKGATPLLVKVGTLKDDGQSGDKVRVINDASAERLNGLNAKSAYLVTLELNPTSDAVFSGDIGFGIGQNAAGAALPSRGYINLTKTGSAMQSIGNARLLNLKLENTGLFHVQKALSVSTITTQDVGAQHIHIGEMADAAVSHTLIVGNGGILSFDTTLSKDPLSALKGTESSSDYGAELTFVLLQDGATVTGSGNWSTSKGIALGGGAEVTFNTHDYSMDETVTSTMSTAYSVDKALANAFDSSHIFWVKNALAGSGVTLNLVNEQMSAGATADELGKADYNGYYLTHDLNAYGVKKVTFGLQNHSTVNIGAKTILQSYEDGTTNSGITYNVAGTDAALQFLDATDSGKKVVTTGVASFIDKAVLAEGGRILLGGSAAISETNTDTINSDITAGSDMVITHRGDKTAQVSGVSLNTKNTTIEGATYETTLNRASSSSRADVEHGVIIILGQSDNNNTLLQHTDAVDTLIELQNKCSVTMEDVLLADDSRVQGTGDAKGKQGNTAVLEGATAASNQAAAATIASFSTGSVTLTDTQTRINATLTDVGHLVLGSGAIRVARVDQLARTDVGGKGLTLGITKEALAAAAETGARYLALQVSDSGRFLYEGEGVLGNVQLANYDGDIYSEADAGYAYKVVTAATVARDLGVAIEQVSNTLLYIEVSTLYTPEPATTTLSLLGLAALAARRRRR